MKDKIIDIAFRLDRGHISENQAKEDFLLLFGIRICDQLPTRKELETVARLSFLPDKADHNGCVDVFVKGAMYGISINNELLNLKKMHYYKITYVIREGKKQIDKNQARTILEAISNFYSILGYQEIIKIEIE